MADTVLTVSRLILLLQEVLEENFMRVAVEGEISNFAVPASGHFYLTLKDERSQIRSVMFRPQNRLLRFRPENGMEVVCTGHVTIYPQRGEVQLVVDTMEPTGVGGLQVAFEQLKNRLAAEGLFDEAGKKAIPPFPSTIGVVTSATGAAIHDILNVLRRRSSGVRVLLRPVRVQGEGSAEEIASAIADLNRHAEADVLIVGRGGGSLEDLWAFNEEIVARAIAASGIPVISAVGHEVDYTISDFVADLRAPTPSAAAEMVVRSRLELEGHLDHLILRLHGQMRGRLELLSERVEGLSVRLKRPFREMNLWIRCEEELRRRLENAMLQIVKEKGGQLALAAGRLDALSPLRTLDRGYAVVLSSVTGETVRDAAVLKAGDTIDIRLSRGRLRASVLETLE